MFRKILFLASNPTDTTRLRLDKEVREIEEGLKRSNEREQFDLLTRFAVRTGDLRRSLLDNSPNIVHFAGHGGGADGILLENEQGQSIAVPNDALAGLFELCANHVECVVLNACYSEAQAEVIVKYIPYVIGMKASVSDEAAVAFAVAFYDALGAGRSMEDAFQFGRNAIAMQGISEQLTPTLKIKEMSDIERERLESSYSPTGGMHLDVSVLENDTSSWNRGDDTILRYRVTRDSHRVLIEARLGYQDTFNAGGPIFPLSYLSPTLCPFRWDFPVIDFKLLNNSRNKLFLTEVLFDVEESRPDRTPLLSIKRDVQQRYAGNLLLINEGWSDLLDLNISFNLLPGMISKPENFDPPHQHMIELPLITDGAEIDVTGAFQEEGVDVDELVLLANGNWESENVFTIPTSSGSVEKITSAEMQARIKRALGRFPDYVGTLIGEISFTSSETTHQHHRVKFCAYVYLANENRLGLPRPPSAEYGTVFEVQKSSYQRRVQISHELQPGEADRFTIKVAVAQSSLHRFRATVRDITGRTFRTLPTNLNCFVPRSRRSFVESRLQNPR